SEYLLGHEARHWSAAAAPDHGVPVYVIERAVFVATLFGPAAGEAAAGALLHTATLTVSDGEARRILDVHRRLYPARPEAAAARDQSTPAQFPPDQSPPDQSTADPFIPVDDMLMPLRPDRLGEDFIGGYVARPDAKRMLRALLASGQVEPATARRCLAVLAAAGARHDTARMALFSLLRRRPRLASHATAPLVELVIAHAPYELAAAAEEALPPASADLA